VPAVRLARRARSQWPRPRHHPRPLHHRPHPRRPHPRWPLATGFRARATVTSRAELADLVARSVGLVHVPRWHQTNHRFSLTSSNSRDSFGFLPLTLHFSVAVWILHLARWRPARTKGALQHGARAPDAAVAAVGPRPSPDGDGVGSPQWLLRAGDVPLPARPGPAAGRPLGSHEIYSGDQSLPLFRPNPEISNGPAVDTHAAAQAGIRGRHQSLGAPGAGLQLHGDGSRLLSGRGGLVPDRPQQCPATPSAAGSGASRRATRCPPP
jgi:hypothetical protein